MGAAVSLPARCLFSLPLGRKSPPVFFRSAVAHTQLWGEVERRQGRTSKQSLRAAQDLWPQSFCKDNNCAGLLEGVEEEKLPKKGSVAAQPPLLVAFQQAGNMGGLILPGRSEEQACLPVSWGEAALLCRCCHAPAPSSMPGRGAVPAGAAPRWCWLCRLTQGICLPAVAGRASGTGWAAPGLVVALSCAEWLSDSMPTPCYQ